MMMPSKVEILTRLWERLLGTAFTLTSFVEVLYVDSGFEMQAELTKDELAALLQDSFAGDWRKPELAFSPNFYWFSASAKDGGLDDTEIVCWAASVMIMGEVIRRDFAGWPSRFDLFLDVLNSLQGRLTPHECVAIITEAFCGSAGTSRSGSEPQPEIFARSSRTKK